MSGGCASERQGLAERPGVLPPMGGSVREVFPLIRLDTARGLIEIDGYVSPLVHDPNAPVFYLEQVVCTPIEPSLAPYGQGWSMEHESLVVTKARPSHVHAALLLAGLEPGTPGVWRSNRLGEPEPVPPTGPPIAVEFVYMDESGAWQADDPAAWIVHLETKARFPSGDWVFSGATMRWIREREIYEADLLGTLIGLTTFGTEVLAWPIMLSPSAEVDPPVWIADVERVPPNETPVVIRLRIPD